MQKWPCEILEGCSLKAYDPLSSLPNSLSLKSNSFRSTELAWILEIPIHGSLVGYNYISRAVTQLSLICALQVPLKCQDGTPGKENTWQGVQYAWEGNPNALVLFSTPPRTSSYRNGCKQWNWATSRAMSALGLNFVPGGACPRAYVGIRGTPQHLSSFSSLPFVFIVSFMLDALQSG